MFKPLCEPCYNEFAVEFKDIKRHCLKVEVMAAWTILRRNNLAESTIPRSFGQTRLFSFQRALSNSGLSNEFNSNFTVCNVRKVIPLYTMAKGCFRRMKTWEMCFECSSVDPHSSNTDSWPFHNTIMDGSVSVPYYVTKEGVISKVFGCPKCRQFLHTVCGVLVHLERWHGYTGPKIAEEFGVLADQFVQEHFF